MSMAGDSGSQEKRGNDVGKNIWNSLLSEVSSRSASSRVSGKDKNIIFLGEDLTGKTTLAMKLQGKEDPTKGSALEYQYMEVQDEDVDEKAMCGIWILEGQRSYRSLLHFALPKQRLKDSIIIITVDMAEPWNMIESLDKWTSVIREHVDQTKVSPEELHALEQNLIKDFQSYTDPTEASTDDSSAPVRPAASREGEEGEDQVSIPLGENTLTCNLGISIIVVCTKCDQAEKLEKDYDYREEHFDFIQYHLRSFCLKYGAALFYTSVKDNKNIEILHKYLLHKLYGFPFNVPASVVDKDAVFVPSGWDSEKKINIISDNFSKVSSNEAFEEVISRPIVRKPLQEMKELTAEDEQLFLSKAQSLLSAPPAGPGAGATRAGVPTRSPAEASRMKTAQAGRVGYGGLSGAAASKIKPDPNKPAQSNERVLANFFNSLLNKKPGSPASPGKAPTEKSAADMSRLQQHSNNKRNSSSPTKQPTQAS